MRYESTVSDRQAATTIARITAKRAMRSGTVWGALFGLLVANEALSYHRNFPTAAAREEFVHTIGSNTALTAIIGPARQVGTLGGFVAWRVLGLLIIVGAIWGLLTATRLLRREEDGGRWELLLAGRTTRQHATVQAIAGLAAGWAVLWAFTAALTAAAGTRPSVGFPVSASLFYATAATASAAMFLAIGALASQLVPSRRQANGLGAVAFATFYLIRMVADSGAAPAWLRWASPLGWAENLRPLTGSEPLALIPIVMIIGVSAGAAVTLAARRDLGGAVLMRHHPGRAGTRLLGGPVRLVIWLERWTALSWIGGLAALALIFGITARSAAAGNVGVSSITQQLGRLGARAVGPAAAWIGYEFIFLAALIAFAAAAQISAVRSEEADGQLDNLLARHLDRGKWLAGRLGFSVMLVLGCGLAAGMGGWIGITTRNSAVGLAAMMQAGLNAAVPALFVLGLGTLLYGLVPRLAAPILYGVVLWSFLVEIIGSSITGNHWLLDTAILTHLGPVPATGLRWGALAWFIGLAVIATLAGLAAFRRRDLATA
jgi:polyether ionophore transport system permease protein